jgi:hypothetical protein
MLPLITLAFRVAFSAQKAKIFCDADQRKVLALFQMLHEGDPQLNSNISEAELKRLTRPLPET